MTFNGLIKNTDKKTALVLVSVPIILFVYLYYGMHESFVRYLPLITVDEFFSMYAYIYEYLSSFLWLFVLPLIIIKLFLGEKIRNYGLGAGDAKYGIRAALLCMALVLPFLFLGTQMPDMQATYPHVKSIIHKGKYFLILEFFYAFYYIGWEFFFRGYMLFSLREKLGDLNAILIQTMASSLMHIGKPGGEFVGSIVVGILFGYLVLRARSIWYPFLIHLFIGIATDVLMVVQFY